MANLQDRVPAANLPLNDDIGEEKRLAMYPRKSSSARPSSGPTICSCKTW